MKRFSLFAIMAIMAISTVFTSCTSDDEIQTNQAELTKTLESSGYLETSEMLQKLSGFNDSIKATRATTRGWGKKDYINVTIADIEGAYAGGKAGAWLGGKIGAGLGNPITGAVFGGFLGAVAVGGFNSWRNSPGCSIVKPNDIFTGMMQTIPFTINDRLSVNDDVWVSAKKIDEEKISIKSEIESKVNLTDKQMSVGKAHNIVLGTLDGTVKMAPINKEVTDNELVCQIIESKEFEQLYETGMNELQNDTCKIKADYVIKLFNDVLANYPSDNMDVVMLINEYKNVIDTCNELTEEEKDWVCGALATALYSFNYWNTTAKKAE